MTSPPTMMTLTHVSFGYPPHGLARPAVADINLTITDHEMLAIIGPNGAGKSTLLKLMLGQLKPQQGQIQVMGTTAQAARRRIGYVPQRAEIDSTIPATVLDLVLTGRLAQSRWGFRYSRKHRQSAMQALEQTQTADLADRPLHALSGGQRQRVLIARALAGTPAMLLLDEPTTGIDPITQENLTVLLHQLNQSMPIIIVSHDISFAGRHVHRVACLNIHMHLHRPDQLNAKTLEKTYGRQVRPIEHAEDCPLADPPCPHANCPSTNCPGDARA